MYMNLRRELNSIGESRYTFSWLLFRTLVLSIMYSGINSFHVFAQHNHEISNRAITPFTEDDFYQIITVPVPDFIKLEVGGLAQMPDGRLAVTTRMGEVWIIENPIMENNSKPNFKLFASGLHEPLGLAYKDGAFYVAQRAELTRLTDTDGDDVADNFETICTWPLSGNYCEYNHGPVIGSDGNFYINFNLADNGMGTSMEPFFGEMGSHAKWRGWMVKITPEGELMPFAAGMRSPAGIGKNIQGDIFYTENQGGWVGTGYITHVEAGDFFGHPSSLKSASEPESNIKLDTSYLPRNGPLLHDLDVPHFKIPSVRFPHGILGVSLAGFVADNTNGGFGPFENQLFVGDEGHANIMRVFLEKVNGEYQGVVFPFRKGFVSGILRMEWGNDNSIFVGMSDRGWNSIGPERYGLQRLVWTGKTPFEIKTVKAKPDGFELEFTLPTDPKTASNPDSYKIYGFDYAYHMAYGSEVYDKKNCSVKGIKLSNDGLRARLIVDGLREGYIHELRSEGVRSSDGNPLLHNFGYYSLNAIPEGNRLDLNDKDIVKAENAILPQASIVAKEKKTAKAKVSTNAVRSKHLTEMPSFWKNGPDITITIGTKPGLKYDLENFEVRPGAKVKLVFNNDDDMQHNLVLVLPNTADEVGEMALTLGLEGAAMHYVPKSKNVLYHTSLLQPRTTEAIYFTAPKKEGQYTYVCTYPGHYMIMRGTMKVTN